MGSRSDSSSQVDNYLWGRTLHLSNIYTACKTNIVDIFHGLELMQNEIIIMYIYHALINTLSAHMIHINLNTTLYTRVEHLPKQFTYGIIWKHTHMHAHTPARTHACTHARTHARTHTHTQCAHNDYSRNWVLILVGVAILWEEEGFQRCHFWKKSGDKKSGHKCSDHQHAVWGKDRCWNCPTTGTKKWKN